MAFPMPASRQVWNFSSSQFHAFMLQRQATEARLPWHVRANGTEHRPIPGLAIRFRLSSKDHLEERGLTIPKIWGDAMDTRNDTRDTQADQLVEEALHELGSLPFDDPDDYAEQCNYAGCYPWIGEVIYAHPQDSVMISGLGTRNRETEEDTDFLC